MKNNSREMEKIEEFAKSTLGGMPEVIKLLGNHNVDLAKEQFRENTELYLGRTNVPKKILPLIALAVSLANGQSSSAMIHFKLAKSFGAKMLEVLDAIKASKMAVMSSTMSVMKSIVPIMERHSGKKNSPDEVNKVIENIKKESGFNSIPLSLESTAMLSIDMVSEHMKEKTELLSPFMLDQKYMYLMAFSVEVSLSFDECAQIYLEKFFLSGGTKGEAEDAISIARFITGNKVITSAIEILKW